MAPFTPFLSEELYQKLTGAESVHLLDWPEFGHINELLITDMVKAREYITQGLSKRADDGIKVRQPLQRVTIPELPDLYRDIIAEELNVKEVVWGKELELDTKLTPSLKQEGLAREIIRQVQNARKQAGLNVDDRIALHLETEVKELEQAITEYTQMIKSEALVKQLTRRGSGSFETSVKIEGHELTIKLTKSL